MKLKNWKLNRRSFIKRSLYALLSLEILYVIVRILGRHKNGGSGEHWFAAGHIAFFDNNRVYPFRASHFYLSRLEDGGLLAISTKCTHLGCTIQFNTNKDRFVCPCHASVFNRYGEVLSPPATRALDIFPVEVRDGQVMVNTSRPVRRTRYEANQLSYA